MTDSTQQTATTAPAADTPADQLTVAILGGTGDQGSGLARRLAVAGHPVVLGSRDAARATSRADELSATLPAGVSVSGADNAAAAAAGDVVIVAVPYDGHRELLAELSGTLAGKVVVDCVNPLGFDSHGAYVLDVEEGSAAQQAASVLPDSVVVGAFHHMSAVLLLDPEVERLETDVMVLGEDRAATDLVQAMVARIPGMRGVYSGRLRNARQVEGLTANLVSVNRRYKAHAGVRITDV